MTQHELAKAVGCSPSTISGIENKKIGDVTLEHLVALARVLGTSTDDLLGLTEDEGAERGELIGVG
jgi:transcriptional regulator with XRE-family HTH domain